MIVLHVLSVRSVSTFNHCAKCQIFFLYEHILIILKITFLNSLYRVVICLSLVQVIFWEKGSQQSEAERVRIINTNALLSGLKGSTVYLISVRAQNSAGLGPCSPAFNVTTRKPREFLHTGQKNVLCVIVIDLLKSFLTLIIKVMLWNFLFTSMQFKR